MNYIEEREDKEQKKIRCSKYVIQVLRELLQEQTISDLPQFVSFREIYEFSKQHCVEYMVLQGLLTFGEQTLIQMDEKVYQEWSHRCQMLLTQSMVQLGERDHIYRCMSENGVELLPIKGCWLKELYPQWDYRQMSDLDMMIHPKDAARVQDLMLELGYQGVQYQQENHNAYQKKPYMRVEFHTELLPKEASHGDYYADLWDRVQATSKGERLYRMSTEDEYIFQMLHLKKHMDYAGAGIRNIMDIYVYQSHYPDMDAEYLKEQFAQLEITEFVSQMEELAKCWFVTGTNLPEKLYEITELILGAGAYGTQELEISQRINYLMEKYRSYHRAKFHYYFQRLFPTKSEMHRLFPIVKKIPILLPIFWMFRLLRVCILKPQAVLYEVRITKKKNMANRMIKNLSI